MRKSYTTKHTFVLAKIEEKKQKDDDPLTVHTFKCGDNEIKIVENTLLFPYQTKLNVEMVFTKETSQKTLDFDPDDDDN